MTVRLGEGIDFRPPAPPPAPPPQPLTAADLAGWKDDLARAVAFAVAQAVAAVPPPTVTVPPIDLADVINAVQGIKGPASADEIAAALAPYLAARDPGGTVDMEPVVASIRDLVEKVDFRLKGIGPAFGASGPSNIADNPDRKLGHVTVDNAYLANQAGTWNYVAGSLTGAGSVTGSGKCQAIRVFANGADSSFNVNGGQTVTVRSGTGVDINPQGTVSAPVVNWVSGSIDVYIEGLT